METPNFTYINDLAGDDLQFKKKLLSILKSELPIEIEDYLKSFKSGDFNKSAESVHKIKHKITILGLEKTYILAEQYEEELKVGNASFHKKFMEILDGMINFLNKEI